MRVKTFFARMRMLWLLAGMLAALLLFTAAVGDVSRERGEDGRRMLEQSLRRAAVACYATEGFYPPDLEYLQERCGVQLNEDRYAVFYEVFAENLMPQITVVELT